MKFVSYALISTQLRLLHTIDALEHYHYSSKYTMDKQEYFQLQITLWVNTRYELCVRMWDSYTNPSKLKRIEQFEIFGLMNRIHDKNLWKKGRRIESAIQILKVWIRDSGFVSIRIRKSVFLRICFVL